MPTRSARPSRRIPSATSKVAILPEATTGVAKPAARTAPRMPSARKAFTAGGSPLRRGMQTWPLWPV